MVVTMAWRQCWWWCLVTVTVSAIPYVTWPLAPSPPCIPTDTTRRGARPGYKLWRTFNLLPGLHSTYKTRTLTLTGALFIRDFPLTHWLTNGHSLTLSCFMLLSLFTRSLTHCSCFTNVSSCILFFTHSCSLVFTHSLPLACFMVSSFTPSLTRCSYFTILNHLCFVFFNLSCSLVFTKSLTHSFTLACFMVPSFTRSLTPCPSLTNLSSCVFFFNHPCSLVLTHITHILTHLLVI